MSLLKSKGAVSKLGIIFSATCGCLLLGKSLGCEELLTRFRIGGDQTVPEPEYDKICGGIEIEQLRLGISLVERKIVG